MRRVNVFRDEHSGQAQRYDSMLLLEPFVLCGCAPGGQHGNVAYHGRPDWPAGMYYVPCSTTATQPTRGSRRLLTLSPPSPACPVLRPRGWPGRLLAASARTQGW